MFHSIFFFFFRNEHRERRANAIRELDNIGRDLINELGLERAFNDPLPAAKTNFTLSLTISKEPRMCPTLFFHDNEYFKMVSLLRREHTCVMPIVVNETTQKDIVEGYNLETRSTDVHVTFHYVVRWLIDCMMLKAFGRRMDLETRLDNLGRAPTPYEYREIYLLLRTDVEEMGKLWWLNMVQCRMVYVQHRKS